MMNRDKAEKIAAIVLFAVLAIIFVIQNAHALSTTCPGFLDNGKCLTIDKQPYQFGYYDGKQVGPIAFYQVDDAAIQRHHHIQMHITEQGKYGQ